MNCKEPTGGPPLIDRQILGKSQYRSSPRFVTVGDDNPAWDILIRKLDFQSQMKIYQQSQRLADVVNENAEHELRKFRRHIRDDKYMYVATRLTLIGSQI